MTTPKLASNVWTYVCWETSLYVRLQVVGRCTLLTVNSSIRLAGSGPWPTLKFFPEIPGAVGRKQVKNVPDIQQNRQGLQILYREFLRVEIHVF